MVQYNTSVRDVVIRVFIVRVILFGLDFYEGSHGGISMQ